MLGGSKKTEQRSGTAMLGRTGGNESSMSIIGPGMNIVGDLVTDGTVRVEGRIEGTVRAGKAVVIGKGGEVVGDVLTQDAVIGGTVRGTVVAESRLELQATSDIEGQIRARSAHLVLEEGARFNGQIQMLDGSEALALPAPPRVENSTNS
jgi:cytoskeletal protein CcmA (bactofilin family)